MPNALTWLFLCALVAASATRLWLAARQIRHVKAHRDAVPPSFASTIALSAHQKAADYTTAKARLGMIDVLISAATLLAFTLGGLLQWLSGAWAQLFAAGSIAHGTALLLSLIFIQSLIALPLTAYRTFNIEARFGFNRMTVPLFIADLVKHATAGLVVGVRLLGGVLWLMGKLGSYGWFYGWVLWAAFAIVFMMFLPPFTLPLFNKSAPIADGELASRM